MDPDDILEAALGVRADLERGVKNIETKYSAFAKKYPALFEMCISEDFDLPNLECAVSLLKNMKQCGMTEYDASVRFGTFMVDKYIKKTGPA
jgi:hypothetical protein